MKLNIRGEKTNITEAMKTYAEEKIQKFLIIRHFLIFIAFLAKTKDAHPFPSFYSVSPRMDRVA